MKAVIAAFALALSSTSYASYLESCEFTATVLDVTSLSTLDNRQAEPQTAVKIAISSAIDQGSHSPDACASRVGTEEVLLLDGSSVQQLAEGDVIRLDYFYINSLTPDGVVSSTSWSLITE